MKKLYTLFLAAIVLTSIGFVKNASAADNLLDFEPPGPASCDMPLGVLVSNVTHNTATINWNEALGASYYYVRYKLTTANYWSTRYASDTFCTLTYLSDTSIYEYEVRSYCGYGLYSTYTTISTFTTLSNSSPSTCGAPSNASAGSITSNSALISWKGTAGVYGYYVQFKKPTETYWHTYYATDTFRTINYLDDSSVYDYQVRSYCMYGIYSTWTAISSFTTLGGSGNSCGAPSNPTVSSITNSTALISWDAAAGVYSYNVRFRKPTDTYWHTYYANDTFRTITYLTDSSVYEYQVRSYCLYGNYSSWTAVDTFTSLSGSGSSCSAPSQAVVGSVTNNSALISWNAAPGVYSYYIRFRKPTDTYWHTYYANDTFRTITYLTDSSVYEYQVRSYCLYGNYSAWTAVDTFTTLGGGNSSCGDPSNPVVGNITQNTALIGWKGSPGVYGYYVRFKQLTQTYWYNYYSADTFRTLYGLTDTTRYEYQVRSYCMYGNYSSWTAVDTFTTLSSNSPSSCPPPTNATLINLTNNTATVNWDAATGVSWYYVRYKQLTQSYWYTTYSADTFRMIYGLSDSTLYEYQVRSYCGYGIYSNWTAVDTFITLSNTGPSLCADPTNAWVNNITHNTATVNWNAASGVSWYYVRFKEVNQSYWLTYYSADTFRTIYSLSDSSLYEYQVRSYCAYNTYSSWTPVDTFTTPSNPSPTICPAPSNPVVGNITQNTALITWDGAAGVSWYYVRYKKLSQTYWYNYYASDTFRMIYGLSDTTMYEYQVRSYCGYGAYSSWTAVDTFTSLSSSSPSLCPAPSNFVVSNIGVTHATISWDAASGVSWYYLHYRKLGQAYWLTYYVSDTFRVLNYLNDTSLYEYEIRSYCGWGNYSNWTLVDTFTTIAPVSNLVSPVDAYYDNGRKLEEVVEGSKGVDVSIYPNPASGIFNVSSGELLYDKVCIYDIQGTLLEESDKRDDNQYNIAHISKGIYFIRLTNGEKLVGFSKLIIQ